MEETEEEGQGGQRVRQLTLNHQKQLLVSRQRIEGRDLATGGWSKTRALNEATASERRTRMRAKAGLLRPLDTNPMASATRHRIIKSTRGGGAVADELISDERDRL